MNDEYYLVNKRILPDFFETVVKIRDEIEETNISVSEACLKYDISRSTYYKYKDYIFKPNKSFNNKAIIGFHTFNKKGILSSILKMIAEYNGNVITLNQDMPIHDDAYITITIDIKELTIELKELIERLKATESVKKVELIAFEG